MSRRSLLAGLGLALACSLLLVSAAGAADLVRDGQPLAQIVIAPKPPRTLELAAAELQAYIKKISGAELPIVQQPTDAMPLRIYVGRSEHTDRLGLTVDDLHHGAFRMKSGPDYLALLGRDGDFTAPSTYLGYDKGRPSDFSAWDAKTGGKFGNPIDAGSDYNEKLKVWDSAERGSINAVYEFLRSLGVRWYMPGELGEVTPRLTTIALPQVDRVVRPDFAMRNMFFYYNTFRHDRTGEQSLWRMRLGLSSSYQTFGPAGFGHGLLNVHIRDKSDPTMFALLGDKRAVEEPYGIGSPCLSSEALFQKTLQFARAVFDTYPDVKILDVAPVDGYSNLCQCDLCRDKGTPQRGWNGRMSDYVWSYINRVALELAKSHPDRKVNCIAYSGYLLPPEQIKSLSPNLTVILCRWRSDFDDVKLRQFYREATDAWLAVLPSRELYIWDYYLHSRPNGPTEGVPVYFTSIIADDLRFLKGRSHGEFIEVSRNWPAWGLKWDALASNHLNVYVTSRLYWDVEQDVDAMLVEYCEKFYGPAAAIMRQFIDDAGAHYRQATKDHAVIDRLQGLIDQARAAVPADSIYARRIQLMADFMEPLRQRRDQLAVGRQPSAKVRAYHRDQPPTLDGKLDEPFWQGMGIHGLSELETGAEPTHSTAVRFAWADDSLYFAIECEESRPDSLVVGATRNEDNGVFNGDNIELLLETQTHAYYQIVISPSGAVLDLDRSGRQINMQWSSQAQVAASRSPRGWTLEVRVPVAGDSQVALDANNGVSGRQPSGAYPWYFNVCRQRPRSTDTELSALAPTGERSFHQPGRFAELFVH